MDELIRSTLGCLHTQYDTPAISSAVLSVRWARCCTDVSLGDRCTPHGALARCNTGDLVRLFASPAKSVALTNQLQRIDSRYKVLHLCRIFSSRMSELRSAANSPTSSLPPLIALHSTGGLTRCKFPSIQEALESLEFHVLRPCTPKDAKYCKITT